VVQVVNTCWQDMVFMAIAWLEELIFGSAKITVSCLTFPSGAVPDSALGINFLQLI
jgi:hypothetical protein